MRGRGAVRVLLSAAMVLGVAGCAGPPWFGGPPGHLILSNFRFDRASIEAVTVVGPDCTPPVGAPVLAFDLPFKGSRVIVAPDADVCWRRQVGPGLWGEWNRAYTATGRSIDSQL